MYMRVCTGERVHMSVYVCPQDVYTHMYECMCQCVYMCVCECAYTHVYMCASVAICEGVCVHA